MENEQWRKSLAENLIKLRKQHKLTQSELGEKLNYTDKSVSKWERGDGLPDLTVLVRLSDMFGVSVDELLGRGHEAAPEAQPAGKYPVLRRTSILMIMSGLLIIFAFLVYFVISVIWPDYPYAWCTFVIALPCVCTAIGVWFLVWRRWAWAFGSMSAALWTLCVCLNICLPGLRASLIYVSGGILQLVAIVVSGFALLRKSK